MAAFWPVAALTKRSGCGMSHRAVSGGAARAYRRGERPGLHARQPQSAHWQCRWHLAGVGRGEWAVRARHPRLRGLPLRHRLESGWPAVDQWWHGYAGYRQGGGWWWDAARGVAWPYRGRLWGGVEPRWVVAGR